MMSLKSTFLYSIFQGFVEIKSFKVDFSVIFYNDRNKEFDRTSKRRRLILKCVYLSVNM